VLLSAGADGPTIEVPHTLIEVPYLNLGMTDDSSYLDSGTAFNHLAGNGGAAYIISFLTVSAKTIPITCYVGSNEFSGRKPPRGLYMFRTLAVDIIHCHMALQF
jgi:hypothetical protein